MRKENEHGGGPERTSRVVDRETPSLFPCDGNRSRRVLRLRRKVVPGWPFEAGFDHVAVCYVRSAFDTGRAESMAFPCDERGEVTSWSQICASYAEDPAEGFDDCVRQIEGMFGKEASSD